MEPVGRKRSLMLVNIPFFISWTVMYFANSISALYAAAILMGFGVGCTEAPILTYVGEICEVKYRGSLTAYAQLWGQLAYLCLYGLGSVLSWRFTAGVCALVPLFTILAISMIPETPSWLISRGRLKAAEEALCWLRGWTKSEDVKEELDQLIEYHKNVLGQMTQMANKATLSNGSQEVLLDKELTIKQRIIYFFRPQMRRPLLLLICYFFFFYASGLQTIRPYLIHIFGELNITMDYYQVTVLVAVLGLAGNSICSIAVFYTGKRSLTLASLGGCFLCTLGLALVGYFILPSTWAVPLLFAFSFFTGLGLAPIPWMLQSEVYPYQGKCLASSIAAAASYIIGFIAIKTFLGLEQILQISGVFVLFTCFSLFGIFYLGVRLPETEGRTFAEIEQFFLK